MENLINIITLIVGAFITACFTNFIHWCMGSPNGNEVKRGNILSAYGIWIDKKFDELEDLRDEGKFHGLNWYKPLGMCIYCFGVYIAFISLYIGFGLGWYHLTTNTPFLRALELSTIIIMYPAISNFFLRKIK